MTIHQVTPETWHMVEGHVIRWLKSKHCPHTAQEIIDAVTSGAWTLWAVMAGRVVKGVYSVRVFTTKQGKFVEVPFLIGEKARQWWPLVDQSLEELGRKLGAEKLEIRGRPGWMRLVKNGRYRLQSVVMTRNIEP